VNAWLVPTARATSWWPILATTCLLFIAGTLLRAIGASPAWLLNLGAAVLAAALVAGLYDPAASLLAAMPTSAARRRLRRLLFLTPAALAAWAGLVGLARLTTPDWPFGWWIGPAAALATTGLAVAAWAPPDWQVVAGVAAPIVWYAVSQVSGDPGNLIGEVATAWEHHPWVVAGAATVLAIGGRDR
jgi:hypothetical protein